MLDKQKTCIYFNEYVRCYYDGTIERIQLKKGNRIIKKPYWKIIENVGHEPYGYNKIGIDDKMYLRHRIIAFCYYGNFDLNDTYVEIDHRDGNLINNSVENLKVGTKRQNCLNKKEAKNYSWSKKSNRWVVSVSVNGKTYYGGIFKIGEEALRDTKIKELKDMYQKPVYDNLIQEASLYDSKIKEYPIMIEQLLKKIKELEIENTELKRQKNIITN